MDAPAYARALRQLLPPGEVWTAEHGSVLASLLLGIAGELARVDARARALVEEWDPRTTNELLPDWERVYGLPDPCLGSTPTLAQRRASLLAKVLATGGQTPAYFISVAAALGFTVTITEFRPSTFETPFEMPAYDAPWAYAWQVNAPLNTVHDLTFEDPLEDPVRSWGNAVLECVIAELKPAHTVVLFSYT